MDNLGAGYEDYLVDPADCTVIPYPRRVNPESVLPIKSDDCPLSSIINVAEAKLLHTTVSAGDLYNKRIYLRASEIVSLIVANAKNEADSPFTYADIIDFSHCNMPKPLSEGAIFNVVSGLVSLGLVKRLGNAHKTRAGRPRELFEITESGRIALRIAILLAMHLSAGQQRDAA